MLNSPVFRRLLLGLFISGATPARADEVSFVHDVMAVLSKAGCNSGACHGNLNGKGGLKLSLRGQDPRADYETLVRSDGGRRTNGLDPVQSLLLLKPLGAIPHLGGRRFEKNSLENQILLDWLSRGAPSDVDTASSVTRLVVSPEERVAIEPETEFQLSAVAVFSDGRERDVTELASCEVSNLLVRVDPNGRVRRRASGEATILVRYLDRQTAVRVAFVPSRPNYVWPQPVPENYIDELAFARQKTLRMVPADLATDSIFLRRAFLDVLGVLPTAEEARAFIADMSGDKRARLIDRLLARTEFAEHWALKWCDLLRAEEKVLDAKGVDSFHAWIREGISTGKPIDQFVRELILGRGSTYDNPAANYYRANRDAVTRGETTARLFLGTRLQCAQCHNHPFDRWTQDDYYSWAALFARVDYKIVENNRRDKLDKHEFIGEQIVEIKESGEVKNPRTAADAVPALLGAPFPVLEPTADRLVPLAQWLTEPGNSRFAQTQANFIWYHLFGRGLVEPIDDFRATNPPCNPPLLEALARDLAEHQFDLRHLVRTIMNSRTYQLDSVPNETNGEDENQFSRAIVRRLPAEKLLDAQCLVLDTPADFSGYPRGLRAGQIPGVQRPRERGSPMSEGERFLKTFGKPERLLACECERSNETTLNQAFLLIGGKDLNARLAESGNRLDRLAQSSLSSQEIVDELYWSALTRPPTNEERAAAVELLDRSTDRFVALQDLAWAVLNAKEFVFRR